MGAPTDNKGLDLAPDAGGLLTTTVFAAQQANGTGIIQKMTQPNMAQNEAITGQGFLNEALFVTPKGLGLTLATETGLGIAQLSQDINITNKLGSSVLSAGKMDKIFQTGIKQTGNIVAADIETGDTEGTVTIVNILSSTMGQITFHSGRFTYVSDSDEESKIITLKNIRQPIQYTVGHGHYVRSDKPLIKLPITCSMEATGVNVDGIGKVLFEINTMQEGLNWETGYTYTIDFSIMYFAEI